MLKPVEKPIKFVKNLLTKGKSYPITHTEAVVDNNGNTLSLILEDGISKGGGLIETTWQELKDKRDNGELTPGSLYRITDYQCTTTQENTQSAGHLFDIVLLALSENKLAEEGWAMEHPTDIYDVICTDNVIIKCYYYTYYDEDYGEEERVNVVNVVNVDTLLGNSGYSKDLEDIINHETKTITAPVDSATFLSGLSQENLTYNYFQNSNLSAWKVWYSLNNDKNRFAWADDSIDEGNPIANIIVSNPNKGITSESFLRKGNSDTDDYFCWEYLPDPSKPYMNFRAYTTSETPNPNDTLYWKNGSVFEEQGTLEQYNPPTQGTGLPNGRGVIYRLIDEFNNDVAYDFKNIQFVRKLDDGDYDPDSGTDTWVYTFSDTSFEEALDTSLNQNTYDNKIHGYISNVPERFYLSNNVSFGNTRGVTLQSSRDCTLNGSKQIFEDCTNVFSIGNSNYFLCCTDLENTDTAVMYIFNKKVLTET